MAAHKYRMVVMAATILVVATGCIVPLSAESPIVNQLKWVSAGHTGCLPDANDISNLTIDARGNGRYWNATCQGKVYLCTAVGSLGEPDTFSCAPVPQ